MCYKLRVLRAFTLFYIKILDKILSSPRSDTLSNMKQVCFFSRPLPLIQVPTRGKGQLRGKKHTYVYRVCTLYKDENRIRYKDLLSRHISIDVRNIFSHVQRRWRALFYAKILNKILSAFTLSYLIERKWIQRHASFAVLAEGNVRGSDDENEHETSRSNHDR